MGGTGVYINIYPVPGQLGKGGLFSKFCQKTGKMNSEFRFTCDMSQVELACYLSVAKASLHLILFLRKIIDIDVSDVLHLRACFGC